MNVCLNRGNAGERIAEVMLVDIWFSMYENEEWVFVCLTKCNRGNYSKYECLFAWVEGERCCTLNWNVLKCGQLSNFLSIFKGYWWKFW